MMLHSTVRRLSVVLAASAVFAFSSPAFSQDVTESHLKAARAAVAAIHATDSFDNILPQAAAALEQQLIQKNPDMQELIAKTVSEKAMALAARRSDLEKEAAVAYAKVFSEKDLNDIATFYSSDAGKKLLERAGAGIGSADAACRLSGGQTRRIGDLEAGGAGECGERAGQGLRRDVVGGRLEPCAFVLLRPRGGCRNEWCDGGRCCKHQRKPRGLPGNSHF